MSNFSHNKHKGGLRVFWIPNRSHHKAHKSRSNYGIRDSYRRLPSSRMSGNSQPTDLFDLKDERSSPPPTTSRDVVVHNSNVVPTELKTDIVATTALAEPLKEHGPGTNIFGAIEEKKKYQTDDHISEEEPLRSNRPEAGDQKLQNGDVDKLDGKWALPLPAPPLKKDTDEEKEEECAVKCLYYTMQCCECAIM